MSLAVPRELRAALADVVAIGDDPAPPANVAEAIAALDAEREALRGQYRPESVDALIELLDDAAEGVARIERERWTAQLRDAGFDGHDLSPDTRAGLLMAASLIETNGAPMAAPDPPSTPEQQAHTSGTPFDGDPLFETFVSGWACSDDSWNGEASETSDETRNRLAGYFGQHLEQRPDPKVGDRVQYRSSIGEWLHGEVIEVDDDSARVRWDDLKGLLRSHVDYFPSGHFYMLAPEPKVRSL